MIPEWFQKAYDQKLSCEDFWDVVQFEGFGSFTWNKPAKGFDPDTCCMGVFNPAFDNQPGSQQARQNWLVMSELRKHERDMIVSRLAERGVILDTGS